MKKETNYLIVALLVVIIGGVIFYFVGTETLQQSKEKEQENLAICLAEKNIKMYGALDCSYTQRQKEIFGDAFSGIDYIECRDGSDWSKECKDEEINAVPTWSFPKELGIEGCLFSCLECARESKEISCNDYCYELSSDEKRLYVAGFMDFDKLSEISGCSLDENSK